MFYLYFFKMRRSRFFGEFVLKTFLDGLNKQNINGLIFWEIQNLITISEFCCHANSFKYHCDYNLIPRLSIHSNSIISLMVSLKLGYFSHKQNSSRSTFTPVSHTFDKKNAGWTSFFLVRKRFLLTWLAPFRLLNLIYIWTLCNNKKLKYDLVPV